MVDTEVLYKAINPLAELLYLDIGDKFDFIIKIVYDISQTTKSNNGVSSTISAGHRASQKVWEDKVDEAETEEDKKLAEEMLKLIKESNAEHPRLILERYEEVQKAAKDFLSYLDKRTISKALLRFGQSIKN